MGRFKSVEELEEIISNQEKALNRLEEEVKRLRTKLRRRQTEVEKFLFGSDEEDEKSA